MREMGEADGAQVCATDAAGNRTCTMVERRPVAP